MHTGDLTRENSRHDDAAPDWCGYALIWLKVRSKNQRSRSGPPACWRGSGPHGEGSEPCPGSASVGTGYAAHSDKVNPVVAGLARKAPATADLVGEMLRRCPDTLAGKRDRALLALGFSGAPSSWH
jgi:hypothetical protein